MWLAIDIGNSSVKAGQFRSNRLISCWAAPGPDAWKAHLLATLQTYRPDRIGLSSVVPEQQARIEALIKGCTNAPVLVVGQTLTLPFRLTYETPETLGADRIAAAAAAWHRFGGGRPTVVIDAGTALTIDVIQDGEYMGGSIGIGPELESRALAQGTANLPLIHANQTPEPVGTSTEKALRAGILHGLQDRVRGSLQRLATVLGEGRISVATGGWHSYLARNVQEIDHADPNLVLRGIQHLMELNPV